MKTYQSKTQQLTCRSFFSLAIILSFLFLTVLIKTKVRYLGYASYQLGQEARQLETHRRNQIAELASLREPSRLNALANSELTLRELRPGETIRLSENRWGVRQ